MNGIFANYLWTMFWSVFGLKEWLWINILNYVIFPAKIQMSKHIDVSYVRVYVWFKDAKHVIWMWIWLILKNIRLLDRIWSLWLVRFAHSPTYSGSTGWYFLYQSIHVQITYTYQCCLVYVMWVWLTYLWAQFYPNIFFRLVANWENKVVAQTKS